MHGVTINPVADILHSPHSVGVSLGTCDLVDMCHATVADNLQCRNQGECVSEWTDIYCDCHKVLFEGRYCQFGERNVFFLYTFNKKFC